MSTFGKNAGSNSPPISWDRMAEPQDDRYDTEVVLELMRRRGYVRRSLGGTPTFFDGKVAIVHYPVAAFPPSCKPAPADHPNLTAACDLVRLWPLAFQQIQDLLESVSVFLLEGADRSYRSYSFLDRFGVIAATINHPVDLAECLVHEMAHHKLCALGVEIDRAERIVINKPERVFLSPIRYDRLRPMSAVLHAQYAFTYAAALQIEMAKGAEPEEYRRDAGNMLAGILPKLEFGERVIRDFAETDSAGDDFLRGYFAWLTRLLAEGHAVLDELGIVPQEFVHPLAAKISQDDARTRVSTGLHLLRPTKIDRVEQSDVEDEAVLYALDSERAFSLNSSAREIWGLCDGRRTVAGISEELGQRFHCPGQALLPDIVENVAQLYSLGLVELGGAEPG